MMSLPDTEKAEPPVLALDFELAEPPQKVWQALTEPDILSRWIEPQRQLEEGEQSPLRYDPIDIEPGRRISYRWREGEALDSIVTFSIADGVAGGTRLTIVHADAALPPVRLAGPVACSLLFASSRSAVRLLAGGAANSNIAPSCRLAA
ncbi:SRPBCC family protein [Arvimicrobium flavum]|uniref:SRPBCC family protein n=1 Tax=Arvimicrobium flavum TaxID=3393320 RepID=UPI00237AEB91|nr:SRPBCC domain-containing protein [Mesorhizobium shangrilense]